MQEKGTMIMACGARFDGTVENPRLWASHIDKDGRARICVYDSESIKVMSPKIGLETAPCRFECPCKRKGKRKENSCSPRGVYRKTRSFMSQRRVVITCYGEWKPEQDLEDKEKLTCDEVLQLVHQRRAE